MLARPRRSRTPPQLSTLPRLRSGDPYGCYERDSFADYPWIFVVIPVHLGGVQAAASHDLTGSLLADKYRVVRQIGRGGMGIVYEAEHVTLRKRVAIKMMLEKSADATEAAARFHREAVAASQIGNPHIIDVADIGSTPDGRAYVVMELLQGVPLSELIKAG